MLVRRRRAWRSTRRHRSPRERLSPHRGSGSLGPERAQRVAPRPRDRERRGGACCRAVVPRPPDQATGTCRRRAAARLGRRADSTPGAERTTWGSYASDRELLDIPLERLPVVAPAAGRRRRSTSSAPTDATMRAVRSAAGRSRRSSPPTGPARSGSAPTSAAIGSRPNVLVLPHGLYYGRVEPARALDIVAAQERAEVVVDLLRGRSVFRPPVQAAQHFARLAHGSVSDRRSRPDRPAHDSRGRRQRRPDAGRHADDGHRATHRRRRGRSPHVQGRRTRSIPRPSPCEGIELHD